MMRVAVKLDADPLASKSDVPLAAYGSENDAPASVGQLLSKVRAWSPSNLQVLWLAPLVVRLGLH